MLPKGFSEALDEDLPILFAKIGWTHFYNGTEPVFGGSSWVKAHPDDNGESSCFKRDNGSFCGFAGRGKNMPDRIHIVFLASEPISGIRKIIGLYAGAHLDESREWLVRTRNAFLIPFESRPKLAAHWPGSQGIRRWAKRNRGTTHPALLKEFAKLKRTLPTLLPDLDQVYGGLEALEGVQYDRLVRSRLREAYLSRAKKAQAIEKYGRLFCEVPGCGFDFNDRFGIDYAHVHHIIPLANSKATGTKNSLSDLAIVCPNCHAMIHHKGQCLPMDSLIPMEKRVPLGTGRRRRSISTKY